MASSLFLLLLFSILSLSSSLPHETILDAVDVLSDSGYVSMSLTLQILAQTLLSQPASLTIFAPSDSSFVKSGQPSLDLLRFHFSPLPLPPQSLRLLPAGAQIPTMLRNHSIIVTTSRSDRGVSLNNVKITGSLPIYDGGIFLIYGIDRFFDPDFHYTPPSRRPSPPPNRSSCSLKVQTVRSLSDSFSDAIETLRSNTAYSLTASFLGLQLNGIRDDVAMTVFAPEDEVATNYLGNFSDYPSFFLRHVVPCKLLWNDLVAFDDGSELPTLDQEGFSINLTRSDDGVLMLNGSPIFFPDMFYSDKLVVHGVGDVLLKARHQNQTQEVVAELSSSSSSGETGKPVVEIVFDPGEF